MTKEELVNLCKEDDKQALSLLETENRVAMHRHVKRHTNIKNYRTKYGKYRNYMIHKSTISGKCTDRYLT